MAKVIGNATQLAFEIGSGENSGLRTFNIVVGGKNISCDDNRGFVPQLKDSLVADLVRLKSLDLGRFDDYLSGLSVTDAHQFIESTRDEESPNYGLCSDEIYPHHQFLDWGPTTDNLSCFLIEFDGSLNLTYCFWRPEHSQKAEIGVVNSVTIDKKVLQTTLESAIAELSTDAA